MLSASPIDLSIIIVSWNTRDILAQCLDAVFATTRDLACQVIVVDNASCDGSARMTRERFPQTHLIENNQNVGFARANNQGIAVSQGKFVLLLNSDTLAHPGALTRMVAFMQAETSAGIVGARILNADGTQQWAFGKFPSVLSETIHAWGLNSRAPFSKWFNPPPNLTQEWIETDWVLGAALMIRRKALERVGPLDEAYFMYSEEIDLAYRVKQAGWRNFVLGNATITHFGQQSTRQIPASMKAELFRSKLRYFEKHHGRFAAVWMNGMFAASILGKRAGYAWRGDQAASELWAETWAYWVGAKPKVREADAEALASSRAKVQLDV